MPRKYNIILSPSLTTIPHCTIIWNITILKEDKMRPDLVVPGEGEENYVLARDAAVVTVPFSPIEKRMQKEKPAVYEKLVELKKVMGEEKFKSLISRIHNINYADTRMLIVAESELHRTNLEREALKELAQVFGVDNIRIVTQG